MFELTIKDKVYGFKFGMGFLRKLNATLKQPVEGLKNAEENIGLRFKLAYVMEGDLEALVDVLLAANAGQEPRATREILDEYIEECPDIDALFEDVLDFLRNANVTKKAMAKLDEAAAEQKKKQAANNA